MSLRRVKRFCTGHWQLMLLTALIFALWSTPIVVPLKILIVLLHELSHALMTLLTGGSVESLTIGPQQGGMVISRGGSRFLTLSAGYCGSLLIGVTLFLIAVRTNWDRFVMGLLAAVILTAAALYVRDLFALAFCIVAGLLMLGSSKYLSHGFNDLVLRVIGLSSMIFVPYDIFSDTIARSYLRSDARMLAEEFGGPTLFWGGAWLIISGLIIMRCLRRGLGANSNMSLRHIKRTRRQRT
ncbi:M50 family metallopeptidase [Parasedimentitalea maritima]|uniref:M50 family metallopeptidase n=1 Tax=Parasedimentitalea maritima TaxID=2578117 RepID=UPI002795ABB5|nr:M50 family metallopeptidase [Zongyanglinia marina]